MPLIKDQYEKEGRRLVIITDPHIKVDNNYFVWSEGNKLDMTENPDGTFNNIFIKNMQIEIFKGYCWSGESSWIDFMNQGA